MANVFLWPEGLGRMNIRATVALSIALLCLQLDHVIM
jgi:hypothetical protein